MPLSRSLSRLRSIARDGVAVELDEDGALRAARERLEPERPGSRVEVEHGRTVDRAEDVEDVLPHTVGGRPRVEPAAAQWIVWPFFVPAMIRTQAAS